MRHVISMLQPQLHCSRLATRFILSLSSSVADCAMHNAVTSESKILLFHRDMFFRYTHNLSACVGEPDLAWHQTRQRPEKHDPVADPYPGSKRIHVGLDHGTLAVGRITRVVEIQVFVEPSPN